MDPDAEGVGKLESEALKRKQRLEAMRQQKQSENNQQRGSESISLPKPQFRSYKPLDEDLQKSTVAAAQPEEMDVDIKTTLDKASDPVVIDELDLVNLAPRKPDWDLKRDVAKKLAKLDKRTQRAIAILIRERLMDAKSDDIVTVLANVPLTH
nr:EOG090X0KZ2 [Leptodora kindtii]